MTGSAAKKVVLHKKLHYYKPAPNLLTLKLDDHEWNAPTGRPGMPCHALHALHTDIASLH